MAFQQLDILKNWFTGTTVREINWDNLKEPLDLWTVDLIDDLNQMRIDILGASYSVDNNGIANLASPIRVWDTGVSGLDWIFTGTVTLPTTTTLVSPTITGTVSWGTTTAGITWQSQRTNANQGTGYLLQALNNADADTTLLTITSGFATNTMTFANSTQAGMNLTSPAMTGTLDLSAGTVDVTLNNAADALNFDSNTLSIDASNNRVGVGVADPQVSFEVGSDSSTSFRVSRNQTTASGPTMGFLKSRGTRAAPTIGSTNDSLGALAWSQHDGAAYQAAASIQANIDAAPGAGDTPARLSFWTTPDGSDSSSERMRITNAGDLGLGVTDPQANFEVGSDSVADSIIQSYNATDATGPQYNFRKSRGTRASPLIVADGDFVGVIDFNAYDGTDYASSPARIACVIDGAPGANDSPGMLDFLTAPNASNTAISRMSIMNSGLIGMYAAATATTTAQFPLEVASETSGVSEVLGLTYHSGNAGSPKLFFRKSRSNRDTPAIVNDGDATCQITMQAYDGSNYQDSAAIVAEIDGTPGATDTPGRLIFKTAADGTSTLTERMRISQDGTIDCSSNEITSVASASSGTSVANLNNVTTQITVLEGLI